MNESCKHMFETPEIRVAFPLILLKRACLALVAAYVLIGLTAGYRAYHQVHSVELHAEPVLKPGSTIETSVVSYARVPVDVRVELIQGELSETIDVHRVPKNNWAFLDPRTQRASLTARLSSDTLNKFAPGLVTIRAIATGRTQLTRLPPPVVRELTVGLK